MGKFAKILLFLLLLNSASSYSQEIKVVRSLGFDGKNVLMVPRGDASTTASTGCIVLRLHPNSLAYQLGIETAGFVFVRYGHQKLEAGCDDIDEITKSWKDDGRPGELQVADRDGRILNGGVTPAQFRLAQQNLNYAKGNKTPSPADLAAPTLQNSSAQQSMAFATTGGNSQFSKPSYFVLKPGGSAKNFKFSKDGSIYFKNKIIHKYAYLDVASELHISPPSPMHGYFYVVLWDTDKGGLGSVVVDGKEGKVIALFTQDRQKPIQVIGEEIRWSPNEGYAIVPERGEVQRHVNVIDLKRGNIFPIDIENLEKNECQRQIIDPDNGSWLNEETYHFRVEISLNPWWEEMTKGLKCNENEHYPEYEVGVNARTRQVSGGTLKSKISSTKSQSSERGGSIAATGANSPPTLTIFVDGISLYSSINSMVGRELFIGPDVDRASNYLKGSPLANIFSDGEVKEVLWNGDISDNVNVKKAVNDLEFILLKSSHECGKKINVVAHSMGTVISYLALLDLKFKTKEHNGCTYHGIDNLITLASPLVRWPSVVNRKLSELGYPSSELKIRPPGDLHIQRWINAYAQGDNVGGSIDVAGIHNLPEIKTVVRSITANSTPSTAIGSVKAHSLPYTDQDTITRISNLLSDSRTSQTEPQLSVRQPAIDTTTAPVNALRLVGLEGVNVTDKKGVTACKVVQSYPGTTAANAGIKADDIIVRFDGKSLNGCDDLKRIVSASQAGKIVPVEVIDLRKRIRKTIEVVLAPSVQVSNPKTQLSEGALQGVETSDILLEKIERRLKALPQPPEYLYETNSFLGSVSSTTSEIFSVVSPSRKQMRQMYDELFLSATEYLGIAQLELIYARRLAKQGRSAQAEKHIKGSEHYLKLHNYSSQAAIEAYRGNIDAMHAVVEPIYEASKFAAKCLGKATHNPAISRTVNTVFYFTDYWVEASDKGLGEANMNLVAQLTTAWMVKTLPIGAPLPVAWKDKTLQVATEDVVKAAFNKVFTTPELRAGLENELTTGASCLLVSKEKSFLKKAEIKPVLSAIASAVGATLDAAGGNEETAKQNNVPPDKLITSKSVGPVQIGMTVAQVRKALPSMKLVVSSDGDGAERVEVKDRDTAVMLMYPISDQARPINDRTKIEYMLVCDGRYATKEGVRPAMFLRDVEGTYGKLTKITMSEIESREEAEFARTPTGITLIVGGASHSQAGIYSQGRRQTTQFYPDAIVSCIATASGQNEIGDVASTKLPPEFKAELDRNFPGWKYEEVAQDVRQYYGEISEYAKASLNMVRGDFDGNGQPDYAVMISYGQAPNRRSNVVALLSKGSRIGVHNLGMSEYLLLEKKGKLISGDGVHLLTNDAISVGWFGKSSSTYFYEKGQFQTILTSD